MEPNTDSPISSTGMRTCRGRVVDDGAGVRAMGVGEEGGRTLLAWQAISAKAAWL